MSQPQFDFQALRERLGGIRSLLALIFGGGIGILGGGYFQAIRPEPPTVSFELIDAANHYYRPVGIGVGNRGQ